MIFHILTLVLIGLKVMVFIDWSWWLVFSPSLFIGGIALVTFLLVTTLIDLAGFKLSREGAAR